MRYCLNPRNPHRNADIAISTLSEHEQDKGRALMEEQVVLCQFCKYLLEGALLGDCRILRWIGSGTFGDVYEAEQLPPLSRRVAVKVMSSEHVADGNAAALFEREVRSIAALDHPNIMPVLRVGTLVEGRSYLVMKFAAHGSLQKFCQLPVVGSRSAQIFVATPPTGLVADEAQSLVSHETVIMDEGMEQVSSPAHPNEQKAIDAIATLEQQEQIDSTSEAPNVQVSIDSDILCEIDEQHGEEDQHNMSAQQELEDDASDQDAHVDETGEMESESTRLLAAEEPAVLTPQQLWPYLEGAANALQYAHDHDTLHLDVKPANLLLDGEDRLLLADFGVAVLLDGYTHASIRGYVGTPLYTAPEQWLEQPRAASDQYALAVTCYQLLTGRPPFIGNLYMIMHGHIKVAPPPLSEFQPSLPAEIEAVILNGLVKDPTARYKDIRSFALAYHEALEQSANTQIEENKHYSEVAISAAEAETQKDEQVQSSLEHNVEQENLKERTEFQVHKKTAKENLTTGNKQLEGIKPQPRKRKKGRSVILALLAILLIASGSLSAVRLLYPCVLGSCPRLMVGAHVINLTNKDSKLVKLKNTGTEDLDWHAVVGGNPAWLKLSSVRGIIHPGATSELLLSSDPGSLGNGSNNAVVYLNGQDIPEQNIDVTMNIKTGLAAVEASISDSTLKMVSGNPPVQTITITNKSDQVLNWWTTSSENSWLVVTPDQGQLKTGQSAKLTVTTNGQNLSPNTYLTNVTLIGKTDKIDATIIRSFDLKLEVAATPLTPTPVTPTIVPTPTLQFPHYSAQMLNSSSAPTALRVGHGMVWDDQDNQLLVFGGSDDNGNMLNDLWSYDTGGGTWKQLQTSTPVSAGSCGSSPAPRMNAAMVWDTVNKQVLLYGGVGANNQYLGDLWVYTPGKGTWTALQCSNNAPGERASNAVWNGNQMLLLGGSGSRGLLADFWSYTPGATNSGWKKLSATTPLGQRTYQSMGWDTVDSRLYVFGGLDATGVQQNDFWSYSAKVGWLLVNSADSNNPLGRQQASMTWDSTHDLLLMAGGWQDGQTVAFYSFWAYDPVQNAWQIYTLTDNTNTHIPERMGAVMVWDATHKQGFIYAGAGDKNIHSVLNDLWTVS